MAMYFWKVSLLFIFVKRTPSNHSLHVIIYQSRSHTRNIHHNLKGSANIYKFNCVNINAPVGWTYCSSQAYSLHCTESSQSIRGFNRRPKDHEICFGCYVRMPGSASALCFENSSHFVPPRKSIFKWRIPVSFAKHLTASMININYEASLAMLEGRETAICKWAQRD